MTSPAASTEAPGQQAEPALRADAERNRELIDLDAAELGLRLLVA